MRYTGCHKKYRICRGGEKCEESRRKNARKPRNKEKGIEMVMTGVVDPEKRPHKSITTMQVFYKVYTMHKEPSLLSESPALFWILGLDAKEYNEVEPLQMALQETNGREKEREKM